MVRGAFRRWLGSVSELSERPLWVRVFVILLPLVVFYFLKPDSPEGFGLEKYFTPDKAIVARVLFGTEPDDRLAATIVDIDDPTFTAWREPASPPRQFIIDLIEASARREAGAVLVDVDLTATQSEKELGLVTEAITRYAARGSAAPTLILMRRLWRVPADKSTGKPESVSIPSSRASATQPVVRALAELDRAVEDAPNVVWSSPLHMLDDDGILRFWRPFEAVCNSDHGPRPFFAPPVIAAYLANERASGRRPNIVALKKSGGELANVYCATPGVDLSAAAAAVKLGGFRLPSKARIPYTFVRFAEEANGSGDAQTVAGRPAPAVTIISAGALQADQDTFRSVPSKEFCERVRELARSGQPAPMACDAFRDRFVLIGASHIDSQDIHTTPLGSMPGVDILANSVMGARRLIGGGSFESNEGALIGIVFFLASALLLIFKPMKVAAIAIVPAFLVLALFSGRFGVDAAAGYEAITAGAILLGFFEIAKKFSGFLEFTQKLFGFLPLQGAGAAADPGHASTVLGDQAAPAALTPATPPSRASEDARPNSDPPK